MSDASRPTLRLARMADRAAIETLIDLSARTLTVDDYSATQIDAALRSAWGLDTQLIRDGTYFVAEQGEQIVGCGGWSWRRTLFGNDALESRDDAPLDPASDAARIRAFFVHPAHTRRGIGSLLIERCERAAREFGFRQLELGATLPGARLYRAHGYVAGMAYEFPCGDGIDMTIIPMSKELGGRG